MSAEATLSVDDTIRSKATWPENETTQQLAIIPPNDADTVCAEWMRRGRELAKRRGM